MQPRTKIIRIAIVVVAVLAAIYAALVLRDPIALQAPPPIVLEDLPDSVGPPAPSIVEAPILYDLSPALTKLETAVPLTFGNIEERMPSGGNKRLSFAFAASRTPFDVKIDGLTVRISTVVEYEGRGWYKPIIGPEVSAACGTGEVSRPRLRATLVARVSITPEWQIATKTTITQLEPFSTVDRDRCKVTIFRFDVTERVVNATRSVLEKQLVTLDENFAGVDTKARFESWWHKLQLPIRLTDSIYLTLNPKSAQLGKVVANERTLIANVRLIVQPRVVTGKRPNDFTLMSPIPKLTFGETEGEGMEVLLEGQFTYPVASSLLRKALRGREVKQGGRTARINDVKLTGIGAGRVALAIDLTGDVTGRVYFAGKPVIDTVTRQVTVPDLEYDVGSASLLVQGLTWLKGDDLRDLLRERARLPDSAAVGMLIPLAERGMNRQLTDGVVLRGKIEEARGLRVRATTRDLRVYALARGTAQLAITRDLPIQKKDSAVAPKKKKNPFRLPSTK
ncbi:MAG: DUF4403 family protein [Gemmatimonadaceae bacterium]